MNNFDSCDVIGLDIGGTKTHGIRWRNGMVVGEAKTGSANLQNVSPAVAASNLADLFAGLGGTGVERVVAGSGGVDTAQDAAKLRGMIEPHAPGAEVQIVHDTGLILAAGSASHGIAAIAGTGSVAWGVDAAGKQARSGGWGHLLGDEGSGYWIGREAARSMLRQYDLQRPMTGLGRRVLAENDLQSADEIVALFHRSPERTYWAGQARLVFDAAASGEEDAQQIIDAAAGHICTLIKDVAAVLNSFAPVVIGGGIAVHQPAFQQAIHTGLNRSQFPDVRFLTDDPVSGVPYLLQPPQRTP